MGESKKGNKECRTENRERAIIREEKIRRNSDQNKKRIKGIKWRTEKKQMRREELNKQTKIKGKIREE